MGRSLRPAGVVFLYCSRSGTSVAHTLANVHRARAISERAHLGTATTHLPTRTIHTTLLLPALLRRNNNHSINYLNDLIKRSRATVNAVICLLKTEICGAIF